MENQEKKEKLEFLAFLAQLAEMDFQEAEVFQGLLDHREILARMESKENLGHLVPRDLKGAKEIWGLLEVQDQEEREVN